MLALTFMIAVSLGIIVLQGIDRDGETLPFTLGLLPVPPALFLLAVLTGPTLF